MSGFSTDSLSALVLISIVLFALQRFSSLLLSVYYAWLFEVIPFFSPSFFPFSHDKNILECLDTYIPFFFFFYYFLLDYVALIATISFVSLLFLFP